MRSVAPGFQMSQMGMPKAPTLPKLTGITPTSMGHQASINNGFMSLHGMMHSPPRPVTAPRATMPGKNPGVQKKYGGSIP